MTVELGCGSVSDATGNLLFYTDGATVWNNSHAIMANGTGLTGNNRSLLIAKKPGSFTEYYIFTIAAMGSTTGCSYSVVDMSLAGGTGSVTVKNFPLYNAPCDDKISGTRHCNGVDYWIVIHEYPSSVFRSYLLTSTGLSTVAVTSTVGPAQNSNFFLGACMKISPNGRKLGSAEQLGYISLFDFDNNTGLVSNYVPLGQINSYGCEFSPDGSKFYVTKVFGFSLIQYDLCSGTPSLMAASANTVTTSTGLLEALQLASDGKIYGAVPGASSLLVINNPNAAGQSCNVVVNGQSIFPKTSRRGLPNFMGFQFQKQPSLSAFTYTADNTVACHSASFSAPASNSCAAGAGYSITGYHWNFGDTASGQNNTAFVPNPAHVFSGFGQYTVSAIIYYSCGGGTDTLRQVVNINKPCVLLNSQAITCASLGTATATVIGSSGPFSYTWMPGNFTGSTIAGLIPGTYTVKVFDSATNLTYSTQTTFAPLVPLTGNLIHSASVSCNGASTASAAVINLAGGSGGEHYLWWNGSLSYTNATPVSLSAGIWSVTVTDTLTFCKVNQVFLITQPPPITIILTSSSSSACVGGVFTFSAQVAGGTPGYSLQWVNGPASPIHTVTETMPGTRIYTLTASDANSCGNSNTLSVNFISNPVLVIGNSSICPLQTGTVSVAGANSYTWNTGSNNSSISDNPTVTTIYTVQAEAMGCYATATASIILNQTPLVSAGNNGPRCEIDSLLLNAAGGTSFLWSGPAGFNSTTQYPSLHQLAPGHAGVYHVTVTAANSCTASASTTVIVNPVPTVSAVGTTVCATQTAVLQALSPPGSSYQWSGPFSFFSNQQNPVIPNPLITAGGDYTVKATSPAGCTNTAIAQLLVVNSPSPTVALSSTSFCAHAFNGSVSSITLTPGGAVSFTLNSPNTTSSSHPSAPSSTLISALPFSDVPSVETATLYGSNGVCIMSTTVVFTILPNPTVTVVSSTPVICAGETFTFTSQGASSYTWTSVTPNFTTYGNGGVAVTQRSVNAVFTVYGGERGCFSANKTVSITVYPIPTVSLTPANAQICFGTSTSLTASGTATEFQWLPFVGLSNQGGAIVIASPTVNQTYTVIGSANNCTSSAVTTISVLVLPKPSAMVSKPRICLNETVSISGSGGVMYWWNGPNNITYGGKTVSFNADAAHGGDYTLTVTDENSCVNSTVVSVDIQQLPTGSLYITAKQACVPFCSEFAFSSKNDTAITSIWSIHHNLRPDLPRQIFSGDSFFYCFTRAGEHIITGQIKDSSTKCNNIQTYTVNALPVPDADFNWLPEKPVEGLEGVLFLNATRGEHQEKFRWFFPGNNGLLSEQENTSYIFRDVGLYPVAFIVENAFGCSDTIVKKINIGQDFSFYIPNTFTPNDDGRNDVFIPVSRGVKLYSLIVLDRWGKQIFATEDQSAGWDGSFRGEACKEDVYGWKAVVTTVHGERKIYSGSVTLMR